MRPAKNFLLPLPSALSMPSVVDPVFGASQETRRTWRDRKGKHGCVSAGSSGVRARDPDPSGGYHGGPWGRETRRKANGGRYPLPSLCALCALCGEDQTGGKGADWRSGSGGLPRVFPDHHRGHRGHRGGKAGEVLGLPGGLGLDRESGVRGGPRGRDSKEEGDRQTVSSPNPLCSLCPLW